MKLRPYQTKCVDTVWNTLARQNKALAVMSTGGGKTECFIDLIKQADVKTAVLVGRNKLVGQTVNRLSKVIDDVGVWSASYGKKRIGKVTVVSIHSADSLNIEGLRFIVCDEAHNFTDGRYMRFYERHAGVKIAGFTATPWRGGFEIFGEDKFWPECNYKLGLKKLIADGYLVPPVSKAMDLAFNPIDLKTRGDDFILSDLIKLTSKEHKIKDQVADAMPRLEGRSYCVWQCVSIEQAELVKKHIPETASIVHSKQVNNDYQVDCFESGKVRHLINVMMMHEGYDFPPVDAIVMMRPTRSPTLYVQTIGRGLRPSAGKKDCLVLDYGKVIENCGPLHDPIVKADKKRGNREPLKNEIRVCPECMSYVEWELKNCPDCGHEFKVKRDVLKSLESKASDKDILAAREPEKIECDNVYAVKHKSRNGNDCIKLCFQSGFMNYYAYGSSHPYSWGKLKKLIESMTPWKFTDWQECYDACEDLVFEIPEWFEVVSENGFQSVKRVSDRTRDPNVASP